MREARELVLLLLNCTMVADMARLPLPMHITALQAKCFPFPTTHFVTSSSLDTAKLLLEMHRTACRQIILHVLWLIRLCRILLILLVRNLLFIVLFQLSGWWNNRLC